MHRHHRKFAPAEESVIRDGERVIRGVCTSTRCPERIVYLPAGGPTHGFRERSISFSPERPILPYQNQALAEERMR